MADLEQVVREARFFRAVSDSCTMKLKLAQKNSSASRLDSGIGARLASVMFFRYFVGSINPDSGRFGLFIIALTFFHLLGKF